MIANRLSLLRGLFTKEGFEGGLVKNFANIRYLSNFTGTSGVLLITGEEALIFSDFRFREQIKEECKEFKFQEVKSSLDTKGGLWQKVADCIKDLGIKNIAIEEEAFTLRDYFTLKKYLPEITFGDISGFITSLRMKKTPEEIFCIEKASAIAQQAFWRTLRELTVGLSEREIKAKMDFWMKSLGSEREPFDTIIASGERAALPHANVTDRLIQLGDFIVMDFGAVYNGYSSDCTRTFVLGKPNSKQREIWTAVRDAQKAVLSHIKEGVAVSTLDKIAREVLGEYNCYFGHNLGHGVGLEVHEMPRISALSKENLEAGMVITIEPGVYITGWGGVRLEELLVVTEDGFRTLSSIPYFIELSEYL